MEAARQINDILNESASGEEPEIIATEAIEALIGTFGWDAIRDCMLDLLRDDNKATHWRIGMHVFWGAVLDRRKMPADEVIAWLYHRFDPDGNAEDNEVWSITSKLKRVGYFSEYQPLQDPGVLKHPARFEASKTGAK